MDTKLTPIGDDTWPQEYVGLAAGRQTHTIEFNVRVSFDFSTGWAKNVDEPNFAETHRKNVDNIGRSIFEVIRDEYGEPAFDILIDYLGTDLHIQEK